MKLRLISESLLLSGRRISLSILTPAAGDAATWRQSALSAAMIERRPLPPCSLPWCVLPVQNLCLHFETAAYWAKAGYQQIATQMWISPNSHWHIQRFSAV